MGGQEILLLREQPNRTGLGSERELRDLSQRRYTKEEITGSDATRNGVMRGGQKERLEGSGCRTHLRDEYN